MSTPVHFPGFYSDSKFSAPQLATISLDSNHWIIATESGEFIASHPREVTQVSEPLARVPRLLLFPEGCSFETPENPALDATSNTPRRHRLAIIINALEGHARFAAAATILVVALIAATFKFGLPVLATKIAANLPSDVTDHLGEVSVASLGAFTGPSRLVNERQDAIRARLNRLILPGEDAPGLDFRNMGNIPNAFALPGNRILVTDALVYLLTDDEVAAVIAHEIGHTQARHAEQQLLLGSTSLLLIAGATGDLSILTSFAGTLPATLIQTGYSRDFERAADHFAKERLEEVDYDSYLLADALMKLEEAMPGAASRFSYLSTHPSNEERIEMLRNNGPEITDETLATP